MASRDAPDMHVRARADTVRMMRAPALKPVLTGPEPLSESDQDRAVRVAARLHADLASMVAHLPEAARHASGMSRHLGIVRNTCQRVVAALSDDAPGLQTLVRLPGVRGLEQFIEAMREHGVPGEAADVASISVRAFDGLIEDLAGSHTKLIARIESLGGSPGRDGLCSVGARGGLFSAAMGVVGRSIDAHVSVYAFRHTEDDQTLERALAHGQFGSTMMPGGMPATLTSGNTLEWIGEGDRGAELLDRSPPRGVTPRALLEPFTTRPLPTVTSRGEPGNLVQVIDPERLDGPVTFDVATAERSSHPVIDPSSSRPTLDEVWTLVNAPTRHLVFDIYLHASIERRYRPSADALLWLPGLTVPGGDRWISRFPDQPALEVLGRGLDRASTPRFESQAAFTRYLFEQVGWDPSAFVGFRIQTDFPVWRGGYCMRFEHIEG